MKKPILTAALTAFAVYGVSTFAQAQEVTLTMAHFLSPKAPPHAKFLEPWARKIEAESDGRITIEIFPSMTMVSCTVTAFSRRCAPITARYFCWNVILKGLSIRRKLSVSDQSSAKMSLSNHVSIR